MGSPGEASGESAPHRLSISPLPFVHTPISRLLFPFISFGFFLNGLFILRQKETKRTRRGERETERGRERGGERESQADSEQSAQSPTEP